MGLGHQCLGHGCLGGSPVQGSYVASECFRSESRYFASAVLVGACEPVAPARKMVYNLIGPSTTGFMRHVVNTTSPREVTRLLIDWSDGNQAALDKLMPLVYDELRRIARGYMRRERADNTLQPT